jgi:hypothetical protein
MDQGSIAAALTHLLIFMRALEDTAIAGCPRDIASAATAVNG